MIPIKEGKVPRRKKENKDQSSKAKARMYRPGANAPRKKGRPWKLISTTPMND